MLLLPINKTENLLEQFCVYINGELNESTLGFFHSIQKANPLGFADFISKLHNIQIRPDAELVQMTVQALIDQLKIPYNAIQIIQDFFQTEDRKTQLCSLQSLDFHTKKRHQSISHILNNLHVFVENGIADQFVRTIVSVMLEWDAAPQRTVKDAAKWLKTVLNIPYKSIMAQIINLVAEHLHLSDCLMTGKNRNMDCLELFFLLKNLAQHTDMVLVNEANKPFMFQLNASILAIMIYKNSPNAFYDTVMWHEQHAEFSILKKINLYTSNTSQGLQNFLSSPGFKPYFSQQRHGDKQINHHIFLCSLVDYIHTLVHSDYALEHDGEQVVAFIRQCVDQFQKRDPALFLSWLAEHPTLELLGNKFWSILLYALQSMAITKKTRQTGRIRASAMQLVGLGFSHRSTSTLTTGVFKPLVNIDIAELDTVNIAALIAYFNQHTLANRLQILQEMLLGYLISNKSAQIHTQENKKTTVNPPKPFILVNTPKLKTVLPLFYRANPMNRNRMFTPKLNTSKRPSFFTIPVCKKSPEIAVQTALHTAPAGFRDVTTVVHSGAYKKAAIKRRRRVLARKLANKRRHHQIRCYHMI